MIPPASSAFSDLAISIVSCAASLAVLEELYEGGVLENVKVMGEYVRERMYGLQKKYNVIGDVREGRDKLCLA